MLSGDLYLPDEPGTYPGIVAASGYQGLKDIQPARFARALVDDGYGVLTFDYRGFGFSDGQRGRVFPQDQVEDVRSAVAYISTQPEIDPNEIASLGWALGGGIVISEASEDPWVSATIAINSIANGTRVIRSMHDEEFYEQMLERGSADRKNRSRGLRSELIYPFTDYTLDQVTQGYVDDELYRNYWNFGSDVTLESMDNLMRFKPEYDAERLSCPLLLFHGTKNHLHLPEESQSLYQRAQGPKELVYLEDVGHTEWMYDADETFQFVTSKIRKFLSEHFNKVTKVTQIL